ncbi:MAG: hypothetical protein J0H08_07465 [Rhizobiales bacterium]|nr:hypothetical protein [Hyphomicrobiales bacterium]
MSDINGRYKKAKPQKKSNVRHVTLSEDAKKKYEDLVKTRDEQEAAYGRHLAEERKTRR